jgi:large subunit ribosomal protein L15
MPARKRPKNSRQRGCTTYGYGARKKHRGSGNRGGQGMAGTGKRSDAKKTLIWKERYFGKYGFKKKGARSKVNPINIEDIEKRLNLLLEQKKINKEGDAFAIDLSALGYNKLLGNGMPVHKLKIRVDQASENAIAKVKESGGEVIINKEAAE